MKQKNMILVAIAVGCGLVAAFLTMNLSAKQKKQQVETIQIPSAAKDLPVGTKLTKEELAQFVVMRDVPKDQAPQLYVPTIEELADKRVTRTLRVGDTFNPADITLNGFLNPPEGHSVMTVRAGIDEAVAGFIGPGAHVDVIASVQLKKSQRLMVFPLFTNMLVLAVDSNSAQAPNGGAFANLSMVSFAVDKETSLILQAAIARAASLRLTLRHPDKPVVYDDAPSNEEIWDILSGRIEDKKTETPMPEAPKVAKVKVKVPTSDLAAGTELSESIIKEKFKEMEFPEEFIPEGAVRNLKPYTGKYLLRDVTANFFVPESAIGEKAVEPKKVGPDDQAQSPKIAPEEKPKPKIVAKPKPVYTDVTVQTINGIKKFRYEKMPNGEYIPRGEVPANLPATAPNSEKAEIEEEKPEKGEEKKIETNEETDPKSTTPKVL